MGTRRWFNVHLKTTPKQVGVEGRINWLDLLFLAQFKDHTNTHLQHRGFTLLKLKMLLVPKIIRLQS